MNWCCRFLRIFYYILREFIHDNMKIREAKWLEIILVLYFSPVILILELFAAITLTVININQPEKIIHSCELRRAGNNINEY